MKRDMDLVREILLAAEKAPAGGNSDELVIEGHNDDEITEHVRLLVDGGYIEATFFLGGGQSFLLQDMTWKGHDFLDAVRDQGVWPRRKRRSQRPAAGRRSKS
jgi:hypothetical protein